MIPPQVNIPHELMICSTASEMDNSPQDNPAPAYATFGETHAYVESLIPSACDSSLDDQCAISSTLLCVQPGSTSSLRYFNFCSVHVYYFQSNQWTLPKQLSFKSLGGFKSPCAERGATLVLSQDVSNSRVPFKQPVSRWFQKSLRGAGRHPSIQHIIFQLKSSFQANFQPDGMP